MAVPPSRSDQSEEHKRAFRELADHLTKRESFGPSRPDGVPGASKDIFAPYRNVGPGREPMEGAGRQVHDNLVKHAEAKHAEQQQKLNAHITSRERGERSGSNAERLADKEQSVSEKQKENFRDAAAEATAQRKQTVDIER
jgi:hypothetical protein